MGMKCTIVAPKGFQPNHVFIESLKIASNQSGAEISVTNELEPGLKGADAVYTDVWVSMGEAPSLWEERIKEMMPYQVNKALLKKTGNPKVKFLHCLPAFHNTDTEVGKDIFKRYGVNGMEVTEEVFESPASIVFDEAENRLHTIKAVMVATLGD